MTLRELIAQVKQDGNMPLVVEQIVSIHSDWSDQSSRVNRRYNRVVDELFDLPGDDELLGNYILLEDIQNELQGEMETIHDTCLWDGESRWAIDLTDWNGLIDLPIKDNACSCLSERLARILYEITFWGTTRESVLNEASELQKLAHDKDNLIEVTMDQFLDELVELK